jgi:hypothetical protein
MPHKVSSAIEAFHKTASNQPVVSRHTSRYRTLSLQR